ncbi:hypothetical protein Nepgr_023284 [Nepenthes gracilis]|uniref:Nodulin-like domain-containing protein n=1 Tax=Nepenthes gracilis TaxID=150966 RepID=A0AAD3T2A7_NEPGR|nr:hypothetical protein Nepgr_023284 [Nepenthes gracilis]
MAPAPAPAGSGIGAVLNNKWAATVASIWIQSTSGASGTFGIYSSAIKSSQGYSQSTLDTVAFFKDVGSNAGILSGFLYTAVASNYSTESGTYLGPWVVLLAGAVQCFIGFFLMWLSVVGVIDRPPVAVMCFLMLLASNNLSFCNTADTVTAVLNFREYSGTAVGIMKGFLGLSGAILIQVYQTVFKGNPTAFLLMLSVVSTINPLCLMCLVRIYNTRARNEQQHLNSILVVMIVLSAYLMALIIFESVITLQLWARVLVLVLLLLLLASPFGIIVKALQESPFDTDKHDSGNIHGGGDETAYRPLHSQSNLDWDSGHNTSEEEENLNLSQAMCTRNFWLLSLVMSCAHGSGLATMNNIAQVGESLGYSSTETSTMVSLWSIWSSLGSFGAGYASDYMMRTNGWSRMLFMAIALTTMSISSTVIATGLPGALYVGSITIGFSWGSMLSLMPAIVSEIFGVINMATVYNMIFIAGPIGSYVLSVWVIGYLYDKEASGPGDRCTSSRYVVLSYIIMAGVTLIGSLVSMALYLRTRSFYQRVILKRLQHTGR